MKRFISLISIKFLSVIILSCLLDYSLGVFYNNIHKRFKTDLKGIDADVVFLGNSRCNHHVNSILFDSITNSNSFNMGWPQSGSAEIYAATNLYLRHNSKPNYILIQVDDFTHNSDTINQIGTQPLLKFSEDKQLKDYFNAHSDKNINFPLLKYLKYRNLGWREILKTAFKNDLTFGKKGFIPLQNGNFIGFNERKDYRIKNLRSNHWLNETINLCKQYDIKVIFFTSPLYNIKNSKDFDCFIKLYNTTYFNFSAELNGMSKFYADKIHLNQAGADSFTMLLAMRFNGLKN